MGIPSLFRTIIKKYPDIHYWNENLDVDHLYLDYNCLIHQCKSMYKPSNENLNMRQKEEEFITLIINYTESVICKVVKPKKLVYIAIDGPVPMTKIIRQRARRYKKIQDDEYKKSIHEKYNEKYVETFDSNKITPGTAFMSKLCSRLKNFIMLGVFGNHLEKRKKFFNVFLSDCNIAGEGEQKIMNFMKNNKGNPSSVIYGCDADLIVLSMKLNKHINLIRETQETSIEIAENHVSDFVYIDIELFKGHMIKEYGLQMHDNDRILNDINMILFMGGNDFVDGFVHTKIKNMGFEKLLTAYKKSLISHDEFLIKDTKINFSMLKEICFHLKEIEDVGVKSSLANLSSREIPINKKLKKQEQISNHIQRYEHSYYTDSQNPFKSKYNDKLDLINYSNKYEVWKKQYNDYFFKNEDLDNVCYEYLKVLNWNIKYYENNEPVSWTYAYPYSNSPLVSDLYNYLNKIDNIPKFLYPKDEPLCPFIQLMIVMPIQNSYLFPFAYSKILQYDNFEEHFPTTVDLDVVKGLKNIYSEPIMKLPCLPFYYKMLYNIPLSEPEKVRNLIRIKPFFFKY